MRLNIFGIPVVLDFSAPPTKEELDQAGQEYTQMVSLGDDTLDFYNQWSNRGYMPRYNMGDQTFSFVDADTYMSTPPDERMG
jgi:hypothetical protein